MIPTDNSNEMLSVFADWLEDQDIDTSELREDINSEETNQWHFQNSLGHTMDWIHRVIMMKVGPDYTFDIGVGSVYTRVGSIGPNHIGP